MKGLRALQVSVGLTDEALHDLLELANSTCIRQNAAYYLTVSGYDSDHRELWDIPEVLALFDRLVQQGFLSVLEINASSASRPGLIGAYQLWAMQNGLMQGNSMPFSRHLFEQFCGDLKKSNAIVDAKFTF